MSSHYETEVAEDESLRQCESSPSIVTISHSGSSASCSHLVRAYGRRSSSLRRRQFGRGGGFSTMQRDIVFWTKVLLQWIKGCNFTAQNVQKTDILHRIEHTDLMEFYEHFRTHVFNKEGEVGDRQKNLMEFLNSNYPDFVPTMTDDSQLSSTDYVYVYSLFLHFSCIKKQTPYFHEICRILSHHAQSAIRIFLEKLLRCKTLSRTVLRRCIAELPDASSMKSSSDVDSPVRTPNRNSSATKATSNAPTPDTPKTFQLEKNSRELIALKADLETERYAKSFLEVEVKEYEEAIAKLERENRQMAKDLQRTKAQLLVQTNGLDSPVSPPEVPDRQVDRELMKQLSEKDMELNKVASNLIIAEEKNALLRAQISQLETEKASCSDSLESLHCQLDKMSESLKEKDSIIDSLMASRKELEQQLASFSNEAMANRDQCGNKSFSSDAVDLENLGVCMVDEQVQVFDNESYIREQLTAFEESRQDFNRNIYTIMNSFAEALKLVYNEADINIGDFPCAQIEEISHESVVEKVQKFLGGILEAFMAEKNYSNSLNKYNSRLASVVVDLYEKFCELNQEMGSLHEGITGTDFESVVLEALEEIDDEAEDSENESQRDPAGNALLEKCCESVRGFEEEAVAENSMRTCTQFDKSSQDEYVGGNHIVSEENSIDQIQQIEQIHAAGDSLGSLNKPNHSPRQKLEGVVQRYVDDEAIEAAGPTTSVVVRQKRNKGLLASCFPFLCRPSKKH